VYRFQECRGVDGGCERGWCERMEGEWRHGWLQLGRGEAGDDGG
jgi:hypothetical protein